MIICVASGKGGTGKTTIAVNLAASLLKKDVQLLDCDVEAPNCHIFFKLDFKQREPVNVLVPFIDEGKCTACGRCAEVCEYFAIGLFGKSVLVFPELCHACGGCSIACPEQAISERPHAVGELSSGRAGDIDFITGQLNIGEARATPVIRAVKKQIRSDAITIIDAPPGTSCPMVETVRGSDYVLLVTEPTPFGLHDLTLAVDVLRKMLLPFGVVLNRSDMGDDAVAQFCTENKIEILLRIPQRRDIAEAYSVGRMIIDLLPEYREIFEQLYRDIKAHL